MSAGWWMAVAVLIVLLAISPAVPIVALCLLGLADGLHEGNSELAALPWLLMLTLPAGFAALIVWAIVGLVLFVYSGSKK